MNRAYVPAQFASLVLLRPSFARRWNLIYAEKTESNSSGE
jgi:hypothetical protein